MTENEQCVAIAEWMGWRQVEAYGGAIQWAGRWEVGNSNPVETASYLPKYTHDLNAMHEAEQRLLKSRPGYWDRLSVTNLCGVLDMDQDTGMHDKRAIRQLLDATAAQRCEALLRTLNLWKE